MMTAEKTNIQKLEALLNSATNERQRKMYQALLNKARAELSPAPAPPEPKKTESSTKKKARGKTAKKKTESSTPTSKQTSSKKKTTSQKGLCIATEQFWSLRDFLIPTVPLLMIGY